MSRGTLLWTGLALCILSGLMLGQGCPPPPPDDGNGDNGDCEGDDCPPVTLTTSVSGDAVPDGTAMATVDIQTEPGVSVNSILWTVEQGVDVILSNVTQATSTVALPGVDTYKEALLHHLIGEDLPGGLQDRFQIAGVNPLALEEAALVELVVTVDTSAGTFTETAEIHTALPWDWASDIRNVGVGRGVLLQGKTQGSYNWALAAPGESTVTLVDANTQNPYFTPDVPGLYRVTVTDQAANMMVTIDVNASEYVGAITGQDAAGLPEAANCTVCHTEGGFAPDLFTPWRQSGHAEIFTTNLNTSTHYSESCFPCHTVGFDPDADNNGMDEASDYDDFLAAGLLNNPGDNWTTMLNNFPASASYGNVQCENCHGPQEGAHLDSPARISLSSDVCAVCHGEPPRHGRFQQWQLSGHANFELAVDEGSNGGCAKCHTVNGFLAWGDSGWDPDVSPEVTWSEDEIQPQTCVTCHDPHYVGTVSGDENDAPVRIQGNTPLLSSGVVGLGVGRGAICMTCHNSRRGLRNDAVWDTITDRDRASHGGPQSDVLLGQNAYLVDVGMRGAHSLIEDTCAHCHLEDTPPPAGFSYNQSGTNHTFAASEETCTACHEEIGLEDIEIAFEATVEDLQLAIEDAILGAMETQIAAGNVISIDGTPVADVADIVSIEFGETHGRQAIALELADGTTFSFEDDTAVQMGDVLVVTGEGAELGGLYDLADDSLPKAGWNYTLVHNDGSHGVHNPGWVFWVMDESIAALAE